MTKQKTTQQSFSMQLSGHQARLMNLQSSLQEALQTGSISKKQYQDRAAFLAKQMVIQHQLSSWAAADEVSLTQEMNLGLPDLELCSSEERQLCYQFLNERLQTLESLAKEASAILDTVENATYGSTGLITQTLGLSRLRKSIERLKLAQAGVDASNYDTEQIMNQLSEMLNNGRAHATLKESLDALMRLFQELDLSSARVAQLKAMITHEESQIASMKAWLQAQTHAFLNPMEFTPPPSVEDTAKLTWKAFATQKDYLNKTARKLDLAEKYIVTCSQQTHMVHSKKVGKR